MTPVVSRSFGPPGTAVHANGPLFLLPFFRRTSSSLALAVRRAPQPLGRTASDLCLQACATSTAAGARGPPQPRLGEKCVDNALAEPFSRNLLVACQRTLVLDRDPKRVQAQPEPADQSPYDFGIEAFETLSSRRHHIRHRPPVGDVSPSRCSRTDGAALDSDAQAGVRGEVDFVWLGRFGSAARLVAEQPYTPIERDRGSRCKTGTVPQR